MPLIIAISMNHRLPPVDSISISHEYRYFVYNIHFTFIAIKRAQLMTMTGFFVRLNHDPPVINKDGEMAIPPKPVMPPKPLVVLKCRRNLQYNYGARAWSACPRNYWF